MEPGTEARLGPRQRKRLPQRRRAVSTEIDFVRGDGATVKYSATVGFYPDGKPGEIFINGPKDGTDMAAICADGSVLISIALQYGVPLEVLAAAIGRAPLEVDGDPVRPVSVLGAAIDKLVEESRGVLA